MEKNKKVSFASNLEHSCALDEIAQQSKRKRNLSDVLPGKGILRTQNNSNKDFLIKKRKVEEGFSEKKSKLNKKKKTIQKKCLKKKNSKSKSKSKSDNSIRKKATVITPQHLPPLKIIKPKKFKKSITVTKSTKERLAQMSHKERKDFIKQLKEKKRPNYALSVQAKVLWEKIRSSKCKTDEKEKCIAKLMELIKGKLKSLIYAHDTCRIVECLFALNREEIRNELFDELSSEIIIMAKSTYAKFFIAKILKYGSKHQREVVINAFQGHCVQLFKLTTSAKILETIYNDYANSAQRFNIVSEFYGPEFLLFKNEMSELKSIENILKKYPEKQKIIMSNLEELLEKIVIKETVKLSLTHKLIYDYLRYCNNDQKNSIIELLKTNIPEISHTREGSRAAMICVWHADAKDRKAIVKSFKGLVVNACKDQFARRVLFAIFDSVDDTTLVNKYITSEISNNMAELVFDKNGASVLHYLVHPRDHRYFGKWIEMMREGDGNEHSKKDSKSRYTELFQCINKNLFDFLANNMSEILSKKESATIVLDALEPYDPREPFERIIDKTDKERCFQAIANILTEDIQPYDLKDKPHILRYGPPRFVFRGLMRLEPKQTDVKLSDFIADLPSEHLSSLITLNCGCFALVEMMQSGSEKAKEAVIEAVNLAALKRSTLVGAEVLLTEVTNCLQTKVKSKKANNLKKTDE